MNPNIDSSLSSFSDALAQFSGGAAATSSGGFSADTLDTKKVAVSEAAALKQAVMNKRAAERTSQMNAVIGLQKDRGDYSADETESDLRNLDALGLYAKYGFERGQELVRGRINANNDHRATPATQRSTWEATYDSSSGVALGLGGAVGGLTALGLGAVSQDAGLSVAQAVEQATNWGQSTQSPALNMRRAENQIAKNLGERDSSKLYDEELAETGNGFTAGLNRLGRDAGSAGSLLLGDGMLLGDVTATGVGSLLVAGPLGKGVGMAGTAAMNAATRAKLVTAGSKTATKLASIGAAIRMPVTIGAMESGGAYQQTASSVLNTPFEQLAAKSPLFRALLEENKTPTEAREIVAQRSGLMAAAITAPGAAIAGKLVSKFEGDIFAKASARQVAGNMTREFFEEGVQSGLGQWGQNMGVRTFANEGQDLYEGVGGQAGVGSIGGALAAGTVQAPRIAGVATVATGKAIAPAVAKGLGFVGEKLAARAARIDAATEAASPVSRAKMDAATEEAAATAPEATSTINAAINEMPDDVATPEQRAAASAYVDELVASSKFDPDFFAETPQSIQDAIKDSKNMLDVFAKLGETAKTSKDAEVSFAAGAILHHLLVTMSETLAKNPEALANLAPDHPASQHISAYKSLLTRLEQTDAVKTARAEVEKTTAKVASLVQNNPLTEQTDLSSPVGQATMRAHMAMLDMAPEKLPEGAVTTMLTKADELGITGNRRRALEVASALIQAARADNAARVAQGMEETDYVNEDIVIKDSDAVYVPKSGASHAKWIRTAFNAGNMAEAAERLIDLQMFAQHMQNKMQAVSDNIDGIGLSSDGSNFYETLTSVNERTWRPGNNPLKIHMHNEKSVALAKDISMEALSVTGIANALARAYPELGVAEMPVPKINSALEGKASDIAKANTGWVRPNRAAPKAAPKADGKTQPTFDPKGLKPGTPEYDSAYEAWVAEVQAERGAANHDAKIAEAEESLNKLNGWRATFRKWFDAASDGDTITDVTGQTYKVNVSTRKGGKVIKILQAVDEEGNALGGIAGATGISKIGDRFDGIDPSTFEEGTTFVHQMTPGQELSSMLGKDMEEGTAATTKASPDNAANLSSELDRIGREFTLSSLPSKIAEIKDSLKALYRAKKKIKGTSLFTALRGVLSKSEHSDIGGLSNFLRSKTGGTSLVDLVSGGTLDDFLPPRLRAAISQDNPDAVDAAVRYIRDSLQNKEYRTDTVRTETAIIDNQIKEEETRLDALEKQLSELKGLSGNPQKPAAAPAAAPAATATATPPDAVPARALETIKERITRYTEHLASAKELTVAQLSGLKKWVDRQKTSLSKLLNKEGLDASAVDRVKGIVDTLNRLAKKADEYGKKITPKNKVRVVLPIGTSGSGKSTWIKSLPAGDFVVISPDDIRREMTGDVSNKTKDTEVYEEVDKRVVAALAEGKSVILDSTNLKTDQRREFIRNVQSKVEGVTFEYKLLELNPEEAKRRIKADIAAGVDRANVPDSVIDRHAALYAQALEDIKQEPLAPFKEANAITPPSTIEPGPEEPSDPGEIVLNAGQKEAFAKIMDFFTKNTTDQVFTLIGAAGTGKTTLVNSIVKALRDSGSEYGEVILSAPTHRANAVTRSKNPSESLLTLHQLLGLKPEVNLEEFDAKDVKFSSSEIDAFPSAGTIIIDESSMINSQLYEAILEKLRGTPVKVLFLGDAAQLQPVDKNAKNVKDSPALTEPKHKAELTKVERAKNPELLGESVAVRESGKFTNQQNHNGNNGIQFFNSQDSFLNRAVEAFKSEAFKKNPLLVRIVAATNARVLNWNRAVRLALYGKDAPAFVEGELLMGYGRFTKLKEMSDNRAGEKNTGLSTIANGVDYIVTKVGEETTDYWAGVRIQTIPITIRDVFDINPEETVMVVSPNNSPETMRALSDSFMRLDRQAFLQRSREEFDQEAGKFVLMNDLTGEVVTPSKSWKKTLINKTIAYGYAHTIHKSQGGTYNFVFVDDPSIGKFPRENDRKRLRYVGVTRAERGAFILTDGAIAAMPEDKKTAPVKSELEQRIDRYTDELKNHANTSTEKLTEVAAWAAKKLAEIAEARKAKNLSADRIVQLVGYVSKLESFAKSVNDVLVKRNKGGIAPAAAPAVTPTPPKPAPTIVNSKFPTPTFTEAPPDKNTTWLPYAKITLPYAEISRTYETIHIDLTTPVETGKVVIDRATIERKKTTLVGKTSKGDAIKLRVDDAYMEIYVVPTHKLFRIEKALGRTGSPAEVQLRKALGDAVVDTYLDNTIDGIQLKIAELVLQRDFTEEIDHISDAFLTHYEGKPPSKPDSSTAPTSVQPEATASIRVERRDSITRESVRAEPETLFVFGDNDQRKGNGGQAKAMRGEPNAVGIRTKAAPHTDESAYWSDDTYEDNIKKIDEDFKRIESHKGTVVIPSAGLGTGLSELQTRAPKTLAYLESKIAALSSTASTQGTPTTPSATTSAEKKTGLAGVFPNLVGGAKNFFHKAVKFRSTATTRLAGEESPAQLIHDALQSEAALTAFLGSRPEYSLDDAVVDDYNLWVFDPIQKLIVASNKRIAEVLAKLNGKAGDAVRRSNKERLEAGEDVLRFVNTRVLNLVEPDGNGGYVYNNNLLQSALMAGAQWRLTAGATQPMMTTEKAARLTGLDPNLVTEELIFALSVGTDGLDAVSSIASKILAYWGVVEDKNTEVGHSRGIPAAMAIEVLQSMIDIGQVSVEVVRVSPEGYVVPPGETAPTGTKTLKRYVVKPLPKDNMIRKNPNLLDKTILINPTPVHFFGDKIPNIKDTQGRNPYVPLNPHQQRGMQNFSNVPYYRNIDMEVLFLDGLDIDGMLTVLGNGPLERKKWNKGHFVKVDGQNKAIEFAYYYMDDMFAEHDQSALDAGVDPQDHPIRFGFSATKVLRYQQDGALTPQGNKTMREIVSPNRTVIDLTVPANLEIFRLAQAQALGISVHNMSRESMMTALNEILEKSTTRDAVAVLASQREHGTKLREADIATLQKAMPKSGQNVALHALMEQSRYEAATENELKAFTSHIYVEGDGATNGPINAIAMLSTGMFTPEYIETMAMGGLFFGETDMTLNKYREKNPMDLYRKSGNLLSQNLAVLQRNYQGTDVGAQFQHMSKLLELVFAKDWGFNDKGELVIGRNLPKNPFTVTVYGAGAPGIANKIAGNLIDALYERFTAALQGEGTFAENMFPGPNAETKLNELYRALGGMLNNVTRSSQNGLYVESKAIFNTQVEIDYEGFTFTREQVEALRGNLAQMLVGPMRQTINAVMGDTVAESLMLLRKATQVQSILLANEFGRLVTERLAQKARENPDWKITDNLSQREYDEIHAQLAPMHPLIKTSTQTYYTAASRSAFDSRVLATGTSGKISADLHVDGPANSGVSGIAVLIQGFGDAKMMQNIGHKPAAAGKSLPVFDGINLALDDVMEGSRLANESVYSSWQGNPLQAVSEMFDVLMTQIHADMVGNDPQTTDELISALFEDKYERDNATPQTIYEAMLYLQSDLAQAAMSVEARHIVQSQVESSIDQMASAGSSYRTPGKVKLIGTPEDMSTQMNAMYLSEMSRLIKNQKKKKFPSVLPASPPSNAPSIVPRVKTLDDFSTSETVVAEDNNPAAAIVRPEGNIWSVDIAEDLRLLGVRDAQVVSLDMAQVTELLDRAKKTSATAAERTIINDLTKFLADSGWKVISGTPRGVAAWFQDTHGSLIYQPTDAELTGGYLAGFADPNTKTIAVMNGSLETVIHELIHAAVQGVVDGYYAGTLSPESAKAIAPVIANLEKLLSQFMVLGERAEFGSANQKAVYEHTRKMLATMQAEGRTADAVNEFISWGLANRQMAELLKTQQSMLARISERVYKEIKKLIWGVNPAAARPGTDMFSNLLFNSRALMVEQAKNTHFANTSGMLALISASNPAYGTNNRLVDIREGFKRVIMDHITTTSNSSIPAGDLKTLSPAARDDVARALRERRAEMAALTRDVSLTQEYAAHRLLNTPQERDTFSMIVSALGTEARIDGNALTRANDLFQHFIKTAEVEDFMADPTSTHPADRKLAQEQFNLLTGKVLVKTDSSGRSSLLPAFVALAMVSDTFRSILEDMGMPKATPKSWGTADTALEALGNTAMESLRARLSGEGKGNNMTAQLDALMDHIVEQATQQESAFQTLYQKPGGAVDTINDKMVELMREGSDKLFAAAERIRSGSNNRATKAAASTVQIVASLASEKNHKILAQGIQEGANRTQLWAPLQRLITEMVGRTEDNAAVFDLIKKVPAFVHKVRQGFVETVPTVIAAEFSRPLTKSEWATLNNGLGKPDVASLLASGMPMADVLNLMTDKSALTKAIAAAIAEVNAQAGAATSGIMMPKIQQLADFMINGKPGVNLQRNALAIARMLNTPTKVSTATQATTAAVDRLVTLLALQAALKNDPIELASLVREEQAGTAFALSYLLGQRVEEMRKVDASAMGALNHYKGHISSSQAQGLRLIVADDADYVSLMQQSYTRIGDYVGSSVEGNMQSRGYYFSTSGQQAFFNQGVLQNVRETASGVDSLTGFTVGLTAGAITGRKKVQDITRNLAKEKSDGENLMPLYDTMGNVMAYERSINVDETARLNYDHHLAKNIGMWRGRQAEEQAGAIYNEQLVDALHAMLMADRAKGKEAGQYIDLFDKATLAKMPVVADAMSLMTPATREMVREKFGKEFWVRKDMVIDSIGERVATVGDAWTGNSNWSPETQAKFKKLAIGVMGNEAYRRLVTSEKTIQNFVTDARVLIIIKSMIVPAFNIVSNIYQLASAGVPIKDILVSIPRKTVEVDAYVKSKLRAIEIEAKMRATTNDVRATRKLELELKTINDSHRRMSIWPLIEAGEFSTISDIGISRDEILLSEGRLHAYMERLVSKLPGGARTAGRYALITKDTALFQGLQKAVDYGDFLAKAVLFDHLIKAKGLTKAEALGRITEEFVHYDRLPGRFRGYIESVGLLWFWNFKIRSTKVALSLIRNNPVHALLAGLTPAPQGVGTPITENVVSKFFEASLGGSIGIGQGLQAPGLLPWVNFVR